MAEVQSRMNVATSERDLLLKQQQDAKGELVQLLMHSNCYFLCFMNGQYGVTSTCCCTLLHLTCLHDPSALQAALLLLRRR